MRTSVAVSCLLVLSPLAAQSVGVSIAAASPLAVSVTENGVTSTNTVPAGPLTSYGNLTTASQTGQGGAGCTWFAYSATSVVGLTLHHVLTNAVGPNLSARTGPHEFLLTYTSAVPRDVVFEAYRYTDLSPGEAWPVVRIDVGDDGVFEVDSLSPLGETIDNVSFGPQPLVVRVVVDAALGAGQFIDNFLSLAMLPDNDLDLTIPMAGCMQYLPPPPPFLQPSFDGRGLDFVVPQDPAEPAVIVFGFAPQPLVLGLLEALPCVLLPSPDVVVLPPSYSFHLPLPASVRPATLFVQGVKLLPQGLATTDGYSVMAH